MKLLLVSKSQGWVWFIFDGKPPSLVARAPSAKGNLDSVRKAAWKKVPESRNCKEVVCHSIDKKPKWFEGWEAANLDLGKGKLYALKHPAFPRLLKIGFTEKPLVETIQRQSNLLPIPQPFKLVDEWEVDEGATFLRMLRKSLTADHGTQKRSYFNITPSKLRSTIETLLKS